jgi:hypothetical protein
VAAGAVPAPAKPSSVAKAAEPAQKPARRARAKTRRPKLELAPVRDPQPSVAPAGASDAPQNEPEASKPPADEAKGEAGSGASEDLPFVEQPY